MTRLDNCIAEIFKPHAKKITNILLEDVLDDTIDIVLESIYQQINEGKIRLEGVLDRDTIRERSIKRFLVYSGEECHTES